MPGPGGCLLPGGGVSVPVGGVCSRGVSQHALRQTPLPPVDRHTLVKILPWPNFVAAGNKTGNALFYAYLFKSDRINCLLLNL